MAKQVLKGITKASPMPTPEIQNRPRVSNRDRFQDNAQHRARPAPPSWAETASSLMPLVSSRATASQTVAAGMGYCSLINPCGLPLQEHQVEDRHGGEGAGHDAQHVPDGLLARLGPQHVAGLDVHQQVRGVARPPRR